MAENVVVLEPGDLRAQKIAKAMGSPTAGEILHLLAENPQSLSDITDRLSLPMNTVKYHVENLIDAGVIAVADTRYSVKGRTIKIYSLTDQLLIVAPRRSDIRSMLTKYAALFGIVAVASLGISSILPLLSTGSTNEEIMTAAAPAVSDRSIGAGQEVVLQSMKATSDTFGGIPPIGIDPALAFFCGGLMVVLILLCYEAWLWKKRK
jgi:DNA-binding transcriptional ArsR family regulator